VPGLLGRKQPALVLVNDDDLTFAKIRLDPASLGTLVADLGDFAESLPRALCWAAAWDMTRDAEMPTRDYVALVQRGIGGETDIGVLQSLLRQAQSALTLFADPAWAPTGRLALATSARAAVSAAEPGSDLQLAWVRALASLATSDEHVAFLEGLLAGTTDLPGLSVDAELRWHLLHRLVVVGRAGQDEIEAELAKDPTAAGQRHAAACRAARPLPEAKAQAWHDLVESDELPNAMVAAVIAGFGQPEHAELIAPYVDRYFDAVERIWEERTAEIAQNLVVGLYPTVLVSPAVVERTDQYLAEHDLPPAARRLLLEGRDGVVRALRARARDAAAG
jgi:aminopeptidase N